jgi:hypothetical protein
VLSDHEWKTLREVERRFMVDDPHFTRAFEAHQARLSHHPYRPGAALALVVGVLLTAFLMVAGSLAGALVVAATTGLIVWALRRHTVGTDRQTP